MSDLFVSAEPRGELAAAKGLDATVTVSELAKRLDVSVAPAWRRVRDAIAGTWLVNDETRRSQTAKLRLGEPLPASSSLPPPEAVADLYATEAATVHPGVFTFSAATAGSRPTTPAEGPMDGPLPTVNAENVKAVDLDRQAPPPPISLNLGIFGDDEEWSMGTA
jgi:hypothetical protein